MHDRSCFLYSGDRVKTPVEERSGGATDLKKIDAWRPSNIDPTFTSGSVNHFARLEALAETASALIDALATPKTQLSPPVEPCSKIQVWAKSATLATTCRSSRPKLVESFHVSPSRYNRESVTLWRMPTSVEFSQIAALMRPMRIS